MSTQTLFEFLNAGVSRFHSVAYGVKLLERAGFQSLQETEIWQDLHPGQGYYVTRNGSAVIAFRVPQVLGGFRIVLSHGDSPSFTVKGSFAPANGVTRLEVEGYGGMLMSTWLDRPLTMAGRAMVKTGDTLAAKAVYIDKDLLVIPNLCPHFDREGVAGRKLNPQTDLQPVLGGLDAPSLRILVAASLNLSEEEIVSFELTLCPRQQAVTVGAKNEFFMAPRIDDLECAATSLEGFLSAETPEKIAPVWAMLDNEEVGSSTRQGACGSFVWDVLERLGDACGLTVQGLKAALANSMALSADNGHAVHPNHPEKSDPVNSPIMNGGVLLKVNASKKYTTDAIMESILTQISRQEKIPLQIFANRADIAGGSTLGNLLQHRISIPMADIGAAQLAMHSCVETAGCQDAEYLTDLCRAFYGAKVTCLGDGQYRLG